jgi:hypothetical protein
MMRHALIIAVLLSLSPSALAQPEPASPTYDNGWFAVGLGVWPAPSNTVDLTGSITANFGRERVLQVGVHGVDNVGSIDLGFGRSWASRWWRTAVFVGPAVVVRKNQLYTGGGTVSTQVILTPVKEMGLGLDFFMNVNPRDSFIGMSATFTLEGNK